LKAKSVTTEITEQEKNSNGEEERLTSKAVTL